MTKEETAFLISRCFSIYALFQTISEVRNLLPMLYTIFQHPDVQLNVGIIAWIIQIILLVAVAVVFWSKANNIAKIILK